MIHFQVQREALYCKCKTKKRNRSSNTYKVLNHIEICSKLEIMVSYCECSISNLSVLIKIILIGPMEQMRF